MLTNSRTGCQIGFAGVCGLETKNAPRAQNLEWMWVLHNVVSCLGFCLRRETRLRLAVKSRAPFYLPLLQRRRGAATVTQPIRRDDGPSTAALAASRGHAAGPAPGDAVAPRSYSTVHRTRPAWWQDCSAEQLQAAISNGAYAERRATSAERRLLAQESFPHECSLSPATASVVPL